MTQPARKSPILQRAVLLRIALLLLLLSMQSFTLAHELDQGNVHDGSICAACSLNALDSAVAVGQECPAVVEESLYDFSFKMGPNVFEPLRLPETRAPPLTL